MGFGRGLIQVHIACRNATVAEEEFQPLTLETVWPAAESPASKIEGKLCDVGEMIIHQTLGSPVYIL